ncbi:MAG TPA: Zn-ribbon domain-containing OB-fold protein [Candidatus Cybelea sp.]|nr:Zn-ribbon domain-containing OB-fold protein [Candidatus Cybelea sp.]
MTLPVLRREGRRPLPPRVTVATRPFWDGLLAGEFRTTRCASCGKASFPPKPFCPHCWSREVVWIDLKPFGTIYSQTVVHASPAVFAHEAPYRLCIIDLDEGLRIATRLIEAGDGVPIGARVELVALAYDDGPLFAARPIRT